jgi:hypothetical protein
MAIHVSSSLSKSAPEAGGFFAPLIPPAFFEPADPGRLPPFGLAPF